MKIPTATRVERNTSPRVNHRLRAQAQHNVERFAKAGPARERRVAELQREWTVERVIETEAPLMILAGVALGATLSRKFLLLSGLSAGMVLLHSLQGWYPLLPFLRRLGFRTTREIAEETYALKAARGDFADLGDAPSDGELARRAYQAAELPMNDERASS